nr:serine/threonine-protein kinase STY17-like [Ipomoea batatas]
MMMNGSSDHTQPKTGSRRTAAAVAANGGGKPRGWCKGLTDCIILGPNNGSRYHSTAPTNATHRQLVTEMEKEVERQKELKGMYKMKLERTQNYLRYCLQVAQENGFLDFIINNKQKSQQEVASSSSTICNGSMSPVISTPPTPQPLYYSNLEALIHQAKLNGWYIEPHEIELQELVAQGTTADIYKARWRGLDVAVKCIYPDFFHSNDNGVGFFAQEVETLSRQRHRFVLSLMGACLEPPDHGWIVTEFLGTTLKDWLHGPGKRRRERRVPLPPIAERLAKAVEISQAMQYLHAQKPLKVLHRDLKPSNIFLDDAFHVRVADFGHARFLSYQEKALTGETGTYVYMAPEVIRSEPYDEKSDVYSFGIILNELITGEHPYIETEYGPSKIAIEVAENGLRPALPEHDDDEQTKEIIELIQHSWDEDSAMRPSFATLTCALINIHKALLTHDAL